MKKKIAMLMTAFILTLSVSFANTGISEIPSNVNSDFTKHFAQAKNVNWEKINAYYKASFELNGMEFFAFYTGDAHFMGIAHNLLSDKLPLMLQADLKMNYAGYWITELVEFSVRREPGYSATLESADEIIVLRSNNLSNWVVYRKIKKS